MQPYFDVLMFLEACMYMRSGLFCTNSRVLFVPHMLFSHDNGVRSMHEGSETAVNLDCAVGECVLRWPVRRNLR